MHGMSTVRRRSLLAQCNLLHYEDYNSSLSSVYLSLDGASFLKVDSGGVVGTGGLSSAFPPSLLR